jgi:hypothetical protein
MVATALRRRRHGGRPQDSGHGPAPRTTFSGRPVANPLRARPVSSQLGSSGCSSVTHAKGRPVTALPIMNGLSIHRSTRTMACVPRTGAGRVSLHATSFALQRRSDLKFSQVLRSDEPHSVASARQELRGPIDSFLLLRLTIRHLLEDTRAAGCGRVIRRRSEVVMQAPLRLRFWFEIGLAAACGLLAVLTLFVRDWVEAVTGFDPDHGNGSFEWLLVAGLALACLLVGGVARDEWRRAKAPLESV